MCREEFDEITVMKNGEFVKKIDAPRESIVSIGSVDIGPVEILQRSCFSEKEAST